MIRNRPLWAALPAGTTTYAYRPTDGLLESVGSPFGGTFAYGYDAAGRQATRTDPSTLVTTRAYDPAGRIDSQVTKRGLTTVASSDLGYDEAGNVVTKTQTTEGAPASEQGTWTYAYDAADRMTSATDPGVTTTAYAYDGAGNRTSVKVGAAPQVLTTYDGAGHPDASTDGTDYTTDPTGALTTITKGSQTTTYAYDAWGRLTTSQVGSATVTMAFDPLDRTHSRTQGGSSTNSHYSGLGEDLSRTTKGSTTTLYALTPGGPAATKVGTTMRYLLTDLHEDVVGMVSGTGAIKGTQAYSAWGEPRAATGEASALGYQSDPTDPTTGLVDMTTRNYLPSIGRFTTRDVLFGDAADPLTLNQFAYTSGSPVTFSDPTGMGQLSGGTNGGNICGGFYSNCAGNDTDGDGADGSGGGGNNGSANNSQNGSGNSFTPTPSVPLPPAFKNILKRKMTETRIVKISLRLSEKLDICYQEASDAVRGMLGCYGVGRSKCDPKAAAHVQIVVTGRLKKQLDDSMFDLGDAWNWTKEHAWQVATVATGGLCMVVTAGTCAAVIGSLFAAKEAAIYVEAGGFNREFWTNSAWNVGSTALASFGGGALAKGLGYGGRHVPQLGKAFWKQAPTIGCGLSEGCAGPQSPFGG
ncbi:MAG TPA: RHS repeat-associated core domain-containing protein [Candidatus Methylomirabilis sp.]